MFKLLKPLGAGLGGCAVVRLRRIEQSNLDGCNLH